MERLKLFIQSLLHKLGFHLSRRDENVSYSDPYFEQQRLLSSKEVKIIFDIGAADGRTSELYHQLFPNATIYAFEPLPKSFQKLKDFASSKKYIIPMNFAVSDNIGESQFHISSLDDASSLLKGVKTGSSFDRHHEFKKTISVKTITIEEVCKIFNLKEIDIVKMDTQGAELMALNGAKSLLLSKNISLIYSECQFIQLYKNSCQFYELNNFLDTKDYKLFNIYNLVHNQKGQLSWGDAIFIKKSMI